MITATAAAGIFTLLGSEEKNVLKPVFTWLALLFFASAPFSPSAAQQPETPSDEKPKANAAAASSEYADSQLRRHPWGRFSPGAWSLVQVINETFDDNGTLVSTGMTETRTTLIKVEDDGVTLQLETAAWVSGKRLEAKPQTVKQCFCGGLCGKDVKVSQKSPAKIAVDGRNIECKAEAAQWVDGNVRNRIRTYYNDTVSPFVFKRESETINVEKNTPISRTTIQVDALDMPCDVLDKIRSAACFRIEKEQAGGTRTITLGYMSPEIPGGTIRHSSKEVDANERVVSRGILELIDFGTEPEAKRIGIRKLIRPNRFQTPRRRLLE